MILMDPAVKTIAYFMSGASILLILTTIVIYKLFKTKEDRAKSEQNRYRDL